MESSKKTVTVRNVTIGTGMPKIVVPLTSSTADELLAEAAALITTAAEIAEWRVDLFENANDMDMVCTLLSRIAKALAGMPLLFTFRTAQEGGASSISPENYQKLLIAVCETGTVDLVDVELKITPKAFASILKSAHMAGVFVMASSHDFEKTERWMILEETLLEMQRRGADILKIAVMPQNRCDLLELLQVTESMARCGECPVVTMAMGKMGVISRVCGEVFGSALTFGAVKQSSAPGQLPADELATILHILHEQGGENR